MASQSVDPAEVSPFIAGEQPVPVVQAVPVDAGATAPVVPIVQEPPVVVQASLVRSLSTMRPALRTTGQHETRGVPYFTCHCDGLTAQFEKLLGVVAGIIGYLLIGAIIVVGAGGIARLLASTGLYGAGLGFVAWLLTCMLFAFCGVCCTSAAKQQGKGAEACAGGWFFLGILASILCIVLAHIADKIHYLESAAPPVGGVDPRATEQTWGSANYLVQDEVREITFIPGAFIDMRLGAWYVEDITR